MNIRNPQLYLALVALLNSIGCGASFSSPDLGAGNELGGYHLNFSFRSTADLGIGLRIEGRVQRCASGYSRDFNFPEESSLAFLRGDLDCEISVATLVAWSKTFHLKSNAFESTPGAENVFADATGDRLLLIPRSELPSPITGEAIVYDAEIRSLGNGQSFQIQLTPDDLVPRSGLFGWFKPDGNTFEEAQSRVSTWRSQIEAGAYFHQPSRPLQPTTSKAGSLAFDGRSSNLMLVYDDPAPSHYPVGAVGLVFSVARWDKRLPQTVFRLSTAEESFRLFVERGVLRFKSQREVVELMTIPRGQKTAVVMQITDSQLLFHVNGDPAGAIGCDCRGIRVHGLGAEWIGDKLLTNSFEGLMQDVLIWNRLLDSSEQDLVFAYLRRQL